MSYNLLRCCPQILTTISYITWCWVVTETSTNGSTNNSAPVVNWNAGKLAEAWKKFEQYVRLILSSSLNNTEEIIKINYLLLWVGETGGDIYNTWDLSEDDKKSLEAHLKKKFEGDIESKKTTIKIL